VAAAGDWFAVPRLGRVDDALGAALGAVRGAGGARARRRGMLAEWGSCVWRVRQQRRRVGAQEGLRRRQTRAKRRAGVAAGGTGDGEDAGTIGSLIGVIMHA
jgi:hypothetical protein